MADTVTILCVEDDPDISALLRLLLKGEHCVPAIVATPEEAREFLRHTRPDLLLLDLMLPHASGLDLLAELREEERFRDLPVVVATVMTDTVERVRARALGVRHYITKPFAPFELRAVLSKVLGRPAEELWPGPGK